MSTLRYVEIIRGLGLGGAETLLAERLKASVESGDLRPSEVCVVNTYPSETHFAPAIQGLGIRVHDAARPLDLVRYLRGLATSDPQAQIIVHSPAPALVVKLLKALHRLPNQVIEVTHSTTHRRPYLLANKVLGRQVTLNIPVSQEVAEAPTAASFPVQRASHGGVDIRRFAEWREREGASWSQRMRQRHGIGDRLLLVAIGNLREAKGHRYLVEALSLPGLEDAHAIICGAGPLHDELRGLADGFGVSDRLHLLGKVDDAWRYLVAADVQVHPSTAEGLPVTLMEGAALGCRQVITDIPGTQEFKRLTPAAEVAEARNATALAQAIVRAAARPQPEPSPYWDIRRHASEILTATRSLAPSEDRGVLMIDAYQAPEFIGSWRRAGISYQDAVKPVSKPLRALRRLTLPRSQRAAEWWYRDAAAAIRDADLVIINALSLTMRLPAYVKRINPGCRCVLWYWNTVTPQTDPAQAAGTGCELWTFDPGDAIAYGMSYAGQYYFDDLVEPSAETTTDAFFIGLAKNRHTEIEQIGRELARHGFTPDFHLIYDGEGRNQPKPFASKRMSYRQVLSAIRASRSLVEVSKLGQSGLTLRPLEAVFHGKKLIVTDPGIAELDFYRHENVYLWGADERTLAEFFATAPVEVAPEVADRYRLANWLQRIVSGTPLPLENP
ncbi:MAG: glycosyltransferase [Propionibacteriaceae bacterium]|nr:glycosyltransferase [Propionibacteriaceae bacterium]